MLGELIINSLVLILGYAYPAFECFKTIEKHSAANAELRFWCQYWVIIAVLTVFERIGDIFVSWLPMYGEMKLALIIYLWYPKTKGTGYVYNAMLRPFVARHETDIERSLREMRAKAWDVAIYYWHNSSELGQTRFFEIIHYLTSKPSRPRSEVHFFPSRLKKNTKQKPKKMIWGSNQRLKSLAKLEISDQGSKTYIPKNLYTKTKYSPLLSEKFGGLAAPSRPHYVAPLATVIVRVSFFKPLVEPIEWKLSNRILQIMVVPVLQNHQNSVTGHSPPPPTVAPPVVPRPDQAEDRWVPTAPTAPTAPPIPNVSHHQPVYPEELHVPGSPSRPGLHIPGSPSRPGLNPGQREPVWLRFKKSRGL
ncbi:hypothetical protein HanOQP8_Chr11g0421661 [Helianthus annuus]|nr:hypothetical protein HanLR1_Chr11g0420771 [Helianthus annuus]KAJ0690782.1 hypothetical protein HanOQP8_Chr11g0421661 [Helianthus annuus]